LGLGQVQHRQVAIRDRERDRGASPVTDQWRPSAAAAAPAKRNFKARVAQELRDFLIMFLYLLIPVSLFVLHRAITLKQRGIDYQFSGVAIVNALILAKVMLIAEDMGLGTRWQSRPLVWPILDKSISFAVVFIVIHEAEEVVKGLIHGKGFVESIPSVGGGGPIGLLLVGLNMAIALAPFFAYRELGRVMGPGRLQALLFKPRDR
jgi:hypothetical protein